MSKHIRHISALRRDGGLVKTSSGNVQSCLDPLRRSARTRGIILPLICVVLFLTFRPHIGLAASAAPAHKGVLLKIKVVDAASREPITGAKILARFL
ncbi:MAG: hypothetical protein JSW59_06750, partial [Phycisphaerales bacterium]